MIKRSFFTLLIIAILTSCATPYRKSEGDSKGGYYDKKISSNQYLIGFAANGNTKLSQTKDFILLRASEIVLDNKYKYFSIIDTTRHTSDFLSDWNRYWGSGAQMKKVIPWTLETNITLYKDKPKKTKKIIYDSVLVKEAILLKYKDKESTWDIVKKRF